MKDVIILIIGTLLGAIIKHFYDRKTRLFEEQQKTKEKRYLCLILFMEALTGTEESFKKLKANRPDIKNKEDLKHEILIEYKNMFLFSSEDVLQKLKRFIDEPTQETFAIATIAMRKDLWGLKTSRSFAESISNL